MTRPLPFDAVRSAMNEPRKARPRLSLELGTKLDADVAVAEDRAAVAKIAARLVHAPDDALAQEIAREIALALSELSPLAQTFALRLATALAADRATADGVRAEALRLSGRLASALGSSVPPATIVEITLLDTAAATARACEGEAEGPNVQHAAHEMMLRGFALRLGLDLEFGGVVETAAQSAERLVALDPSLRRAERRKLDVTHAILATLPEP